MKIFSYRTALVCLSLFVATTSGASAQNKPVVAVGAFNTNIRGADVDSLRAMLETALAKTRKFDMIERSRLEDLLAEQGLSAAGLTDGQSELGGINGVDYLLYGAITEASLQEKNLLLLRNCVATMGIDARIVDVATGSIRMSERVIVEDVVNTASSNGRACSGVGASSFGELHRLAADQLAQKISQALFPVKVLKVAQNEVYLNYGAPTMQKGDYLKLVMTGESFVDPDTGEVLGAEEEIVGLVRVAEIRGKFSIAKILDANANLETGTIAIKLDKDDAKRLAKAAKRKGKNSSR